MTKDTHNKVNSRIPGLRETNYIQKTPRSRLVKILAPVIAFDIIFFVFGCVTYNNTYIPILNENGNTLLTFDGKSIYVNGALTLVVDNNDMKNSKTVNIYGMAGELKQSDIKFSHITDDKHPINKNNTPKLVSIENATGNPKNITITMPFLQRPGSYQGWIFLKDNSIPITVVTEPKLYVALMWVIVGILTSIIFWEIIKYIAQVKKIESEIPDDLKDPNYTQEPTATRTNGSVKFNAAAKRRIRLHMYVEHKLISKNIAKVTTIDIATVGFGIAVGFLALLNNGYVTAIRVVEPIDILALFGLGLGIGSLRELAIKATE